MELHGPAAILAFAVVVVGAIFSLTRRGRILFGDPEDPRTHEEIEAERKAEEKRLSREEQAWDREGPQLVGRVCAGCNKKVIFQDEAILCGQCNEAVHHDCVAQHVHGTGEQKGPYR
jgi:hypothetical protein